MEVGKWSFLHQVQGPITRVCLTQMRRLIPLNDSTYQDLYLEICSCKTWCQNFEILQSPKTVNLILTVMNQFLAVKFSENNFQNWFFFSKKFIIRKSLNEKIEKKIEKDFQKKRWKILLKSFWKEIYE